MPVCSVASAIPALVLSNVSKSYSSGSHKVDILQGISLNIGQGEIFGIIGRSGAGKSTLLRCLNGLEAPESGNIKINNQSLSDLKGQERRDILHRIGTVFQNLNLLSRRTVLQNIALPLEFKGASADEITVKTRTICELVGLQDKHNAYPHQLSGGQRQRVAIARALVSNVSLLLCDEFTSALDSETALEILALLRDLNQKLRVTIILVTHDMPVIREICSSVCVMDQGQVVESGTIESILLYPQHSVTQSLVKNFFMKALPNHIYEILNDTPQSGDQVVLRLVFSGKTAHQPLIASLIEKFHVSVNIIAGSLDHVREKAFGALIITLPCQDSLLETILSYLHTHDVSAEILGFIPHL